MKKILFVLLLVSSAATAQVATLEKDTIYKDGKPYGLLTKTGKMGNTVYSIRSLTNAELAVVKFDEATQAQGATNGYHRLTFLGSGAFGHFYPGLNTAKGIAKVVVENDLIKDNAINPEGEKRFLALYPNQIKNQPSVVVNVNNGGPDYTPVERSRNMPVMEANGTISQGGTNIGTCITSVAYMEGRGTATIKFYLLNGVQCAAATCDNIGAKTATVVTMKDNRSHTVTITNSAVKEKEIAQWLADNYYL